MRLECDDAECDSDDVTAAQLESTLANSNFGNFAILSAADDEFLQLVSDWSDTEECRAFVAAHQSEPYILIHGDGSTGQQFQLDGHLTLAEARRVVLGYFAGDAAWRGGRTWAPREAGDD